MREIGAFEAQNSLSALLDEVERGEEVTITRDGKPVARLMPTPKMFDREGAKAAAEEIIAGRRGQSLGGLKIKDLINEGRR